jgi:hypothetical protein
VVERNVGELPHSRAQKRLILRLEQLAARLSRDDRMVQVVPHIREYLSIGVEHVWLVDPDERRAMLLACGAGSPPATPILKCPRQPFDLKSGHKHF